MVILLLFPLQVLFRLELEFSRARVLDHVRVHLEASRCDVCQQSQYFPLYMETGLFVTDTNEQNTTSQNNSSKTEPIPKINEYLPCCDVNFVNIYLLLSTVTAKRQTRLTILKKSFTPWIMKQIFSSPGLTVSGRTACCE